MSDDNSQYWIERHRRHVSKLVSVGHIGRTEEENTTLYAKKKRRIVDILRSLDMIDLSGKSVLDAGCGIGLISEFLYALGAEVWGIDASDVATDQALTRCPTGKFTAGSITDFKFDQTFELVLAADVLYHVVDDDNWKTTVINLVSHLAPGGTLILLDQVRSQIEMPANHVRYRTRNMYEDIFAGLPGRSLLLPEHDQIVIFRKN